MRLGNDFNAAVPADGHFVRHPSLPQLASEVRGIRQRLRDFFGVVFDLESGDLKDNVLPSAALVDHPAAPAGEDYRQVTVDARGFVIAGKADPAITAPRPLRAVFRADGGWMDRGDSSGLTTVPAGPTRSFTSQQWGGSGNPGDRAVTGVHYEFVVPARTRSIDVTLIGGRIPSAGNSAAVRVSVGVNPGEVWSAVVSSIDCNSVFFRTGTNVGLQSDGVVRGTLDVGGTLTSPSGALSRPPYRGYGRDTALSGTTNPGLIVIDWYA